jgi:hypothetical protein
MGAEQTSVRSRLYDRLPPQAAIPHPRPLIWSVSWKRCASQSRPRPIVRFSKLYRAPTVRPRLPVPDVVWHLSKSLNVASRYDFLWVGNRGKPWTHQSASRANRRKRPAGISF